MDPCQQCSWRVSLRSPEEAWDKTRSKNNWDVLVHLARRRAVLVLPHRLLTWSLGVFLSGACIERCFYPRLYFRGLPGTSGEDLQVRFSVLSGKSLYLVAFLLHLLAGGARVARSMVSTNER